MTLSQAVQRLINIHAQEQEALQTIASMIGVDSAPIGSLINSRPLEPGVRKGRKTPPKIRLAVEELLLSKATVASTAAKTGVSQPTVERIKRELREKGRLS